MAAIAEHCGMSRVLLGHRIDTLFAFVVVNLSWTVSAIVLCTYGRVVAL